MADIPSPVTTGPAAGNVNVTTPEGAINPTPTPGGLADWQAAAAVFAILFIIAETDAAPIADAVAWGATGLYIVRVIGSSFKVGQLIPKGQ